VWVYFVLFTGPSLFVRFTYFRVTGDFDCVAGSWCNFTITAYSTVGLYQLTGGDLWLCSVTNIDGDRLSVIEKGKVSDLGNGTYSGQWMTELQGRYALRVYLAVGGFKSSLLDDGGVRRYRYSPTGNGGLLGTYFNSPFLEPGTEVMQRVDAYINFTWGLGPLTRTASDFVTVRWEGAIMSSSVNQEEVELSVVCDDGIRLWVDNRLVIDEWHTESDSRNVSALVTMNPAELYHVVLEYREIARDAYISFLWKYSSMLIPEVVPQSSLYHLYEVADTQVMENPSEARGGYRGRGKWTSSLWQPKKGIEVKVVSAETDHELTDCVGDGLFHGIAGEKHNFVVRIHRSSLRKCLSEKKMTPSPPFFFFFFCCCCGGVHVVCFWTQVRPRDRFGNLRNDESIQALQNDPFEANAELESGDGGYGVKVVPVSFNYDSSHHVFRGSFTPTVQLLLSLFSPLPLPAPYFFFFCLFLSLLN
jgi:hypothetical protein